MIRQTVEALGGCGDVLSGTLLAGGRTLRLVDLARIFGDDLQRFPWLMRVIMENSLRNSKDDSGRLIAAFRDWLGEGSSAIEIGFHPSRLLMHDTTCVPALVDMAALRSTLAEQGGDPARLNPVLPIDVSVDHSIAVDAYGRPDAFRINVAKEIERNAERYRLMKWATAAFDNLRVHPPGTGIMHTINMEQLATVIATRRIGTETWAIPDTLIGTDSHTPMINSLGVLAWGVGGLEAESVMFGMPVTLRIPDVIGVRLTGRLSEGVLSTDLALTVTHLLRRQGVSGEFVEFFGPGVSTLSAGDRAVIANMAPEYGASSGYFAIDEQTLRYLASTGRAREDLAIIEPVARRQGLWFDPALSPRYTATIELDLATVGMTLAGPHRPQDRLSPPDVRTVLALADSRPAAESVVPEGAVAIAAITSCTNTTDPRLLMAAGLVARKARRLGLNPPFWVKTSLAPGSPAAGRYLERAGLLDDLAAIGFGIVGYGCTTCIGNSGALQPEAAAAAAAGTRVVAVLSGNRNFPGRVHPDIESAFLASPPLVVAYALAGDAARDIARDPIGCGTDGTAVYLADLWPTGAEIDAAMKAGLEPADFHAAFADAAKNQAWAELDAPSGLLFPWDEASTYVRRPPFVSAEAKQRPGRYLARPLLVLGDDITTDHISPAGKIPASDAAGRHLVGRGENADDLNVFAARRGNWEVMLRGLFTNRSIRNLLGHEIPAGFTRHSPSGDVLPLAEAADRYGRDGVSTVILAGARYGTGSSRDWAAKGVALLGVRAVIAISFERIHRSNLVGMGILPILFPDGITPAGLALSADDWIEIDADLRALKPRGTVSVVICFRHGRRHELDCPAAVETEFEIDTLIAGGVMPSILARAMPGETH